MLTNKKKLLDFEVAIISKCKKCKINKFGIAVPGEGNPNSKIFLVGEAPGRQESLTGMPFIGRSGKLLTQLLGEIGIDRKDVFITSPLKYYPGKRQIKTYEIEHGRIHLLKQIEIVDPKIIVLLGQVAAKALLEKSITLKIAHGKPIKGVRVYFPTFHPAAALRFPKLKPLLEHDFRRLKKLTV